MLCGQKCWLRNRFLTFSCYPIYYPIFQNAPIQVAPAVAWLVPGQSVHIRCPEYPGSPPETPSSLRCPVCPCGCCLCINNGNLAWTFSVQSPLLGGGRPCLHNAGHVAWEGSALNHFMPCWQRRDLLALLSVAANMARPPGGAPSGPEAVRGLSVTLTEHPTHATHIAHPTALYMLLDGCKHVMLRNKLLRNAGTLCSDIYSIAHFSYWKAQYFKESVFLTITSHKRELRLCLS